MMQQHLNLSDENAIKNNPDTSYMHVSSNFWSLKLSKWKRHRFIKYACHSFITSVPFILLWILSSDIPAHFYFYSEITPAYNFSVLQPSQRTYWILLLLSKKSFCFKMVILGFVAIFELHYRHCRIWRRFLCNLWSPKLFLFIRSSPHFLELKLVLICNLWSLQLSLLFPTSLVFSFYGDKRNVQKMRFLVSLVSLAPTLWDICLCNQLIVPHCFANT